MSVFFNSSDVSMGPAALLAAAPFDKVVTATGLGLSACLPAAYYGNRNEEEEEDEDRANLEIPTSSVAGESEPPDSSPESSSIGVPSDSEEHDDGDSGLAGGVEEEQSNSNASLSCLSSLEESLPIKRGLSSYFSGKSKSFADLAEEISSVEGLKKKENPLNKKRRIMIAYKWSKKPSFYGWNNPTSMPLLALNEEDDIDNQNDEVEVEVEEEEEQYPSSKEEKDDEKIHGVLHRVQHRKQQLNASKSCLAFTNLEK